MRNRTEHHRHGRDRPGGANRTSRAHGSTRCEPECGPDTALQLLVEATAAEEATLRSAAETLSHELRTPLTTIYGGSRLLSRHGHRLPSDVIQEVSAAIEVDAERLMRIVEDLVVAAALPGEPAIGGEPIRLADILPSAASHAEVRWPGVTVQVDTPDGLPAVRADALYLDQALRNVLDNAARYGPDGGCVLVRAAEVGSKVEIRIRDEGPGVPADRADEIFRLFARPGTQGQPGGLGLGLFVGRRLMELMGGTIRLSGGHRGGGEFILELPIYPVDRN